MSPLRLTLAQVAERLGKPGRPASPSRVRSWVRVGCVPTGRRGDGQFNMGPRVKLRAVRLPSGMVFEEADVEAFVRALSAPAPSPLKIAHGDLGTYPRPARLPREVSPLSPSARGRAVRLVPVARTRAG